ncbi:hypothetical protein D3C83_263750 [compost metagenome]
MADFTADDHRIELGLVDEIHELVHARSPGTISGNVNTFHFRGIRLRIYFQI